MDRKPLPRRQPNAGHGAKAPLDPDFVAPAHTTPKRRVQNRAPGGKAVPRRNKRKQDTSVRGIGTARLLITMASCFAFSLWLSVEAQNLVRDRFSPPPLVMKAQVSMGDSSAFKF
ncbi:conserved hypothetical protein [Hyphomicrobiales bacterium]|jgi:hypothetical protein|nr:conserved hypothetical protein [Hyphomicrobiales bacterium]CAH1702240.1 hypothetical protein BOSEA1005_30112 [Hyphomicrobiales bacterium]CAI0346443.1 conserved hypothetical protein [Hyphomicrobiales bacterium]